MNFEDDAIYREAYGRFGRDHARMREDLLVRLRVDVEARQARVSSRWLVGVAALLLVGVATWFMLFRSPAVAYGMADAPGRLAACRSIRIEGWREADRVRYPWRAYVSAGSYLWGTTLAGDQNGVYRGYFATDSKKYLVVSDRDRTAVSGKEDSLYFEISVTRSLQIGLPNQLIGANAAGFTKTGAADLNGIRVDVYERRRPVGPRETVWLNPSTGIPLRVAFYEQGEDGVERQSAFAEVTANGPPPPDLPSLDPPVGYTLTHQDRLPREALGGSFVGVDGEFFEVLLALHLNGRAVLLCWTHSHDGNTSSSEEGLGGKVGTEQSLTLRSPDGARKYRVLHLHDDPWTDGQLARWSLVIPEDGNEAGEVELNLKTAKGQMHVSMSPLRLDRARLAKLVIESQRITLPAGMAPLTLDELEKLAAQHTDKAGATR